MKGVDLMDKLVLSLKVNNKAGILSHVADLFGQKGYNIDSLTVGVTENPQFSRMTVVTSGDNQILKQIRKELIELEGVVEILELESDNSVCRELVLVRVKAEGKKRHDVVVVADIFRAKIVDVAIDSVMIELTGNQAKLDAFMKLLEDFKILEFVRTGLTGLNRGKDNKDGKDADRESSVQSIKIV